MYHAVVHIFRGICKNWGRGEVEVTVSFIVSVHLYVFRSAWNNLVPYSTDFHEI
jgi:hypothetical protein